MEIHGLVGQTYGCEYLAVDLVPRGDPQPSCGDLRSTSHGSASVFFFEKKFGAELLLLL